MAQSINDLIGTVYDAAQGEQSWSAVLQNMASHLGGFHASIIGRPAPQASPSFFFETGVDPVAWETYADHYWQTDIWTKKLSADKVGHVVPGSELVPRDELLKSEWYNDFLRHCEIGDVLSAVPLFKQNLSCTLSIYREQNMDYYQASDDAVRMLKVLNPHIGRAIELSHRFADLDLAQESACDVLDGQKHGVILLDDQGRILMMNRAAENFTSANDGLCAGSFGLKAERQSDNTPLQQIIRDAISTSLGNGAGTNAGGVLAVPRPSGKRPYVITVSPASRQEKLFALHFPAAIVMLSDPEVTVQASTDALRSFFDLTPSEARLASQIATGISLDQCAAQLGITLETARTHLKRVFSKTGTSRQGELIHLLLSSLQSTSPIL